MVSKKVVIVPVTVTLPSGYELVEDIKVKVKLVPGAEK